MKSHFQSRSGVALVIVLGFLVLISALAVAFFSSVTTELKASRNYASGVSTRQLSESAVNVIMGQIRDATSRENGAWASQPGMIRVYRDGNTPSAAADAFFKLYSSDNMVVTSSQAQNFLNNSDYERDWDGSPAFWTDLNSPVIVRDPLNSAGANVVPRFPVIDPRALGEVEGFHYDQGRVNLTDAGQNENKRRLPMPVRWMYVLQDGTLTTPTGGSKLTAEWDAGNFRSPTKENPIVGRIAFWADDDTSKLNLNTAGGFIATPDTLPPGYEEENYAGSYWDTPRFYTVFDRGMPNKESDGEPKAGRPVPNQASGGLALCQLLQNEFQRYPGHPATTSLGLLFTKMADPGAGRPNATSELTSKDLYKILPRFGITNSKNFNPGSSEGGTQRVIKGTDLPNPSPDDLQIQVKQDRLYSSVDEMVFAAKSGLASSTDYTRKKNDEVLQKTDVITPEFVDKFRFFLTAQSRAPELNLFGQPKVSIWPVRHETGAAGAPSGLNAFDNVILFCSTIGMGNTNSVQPNTTTVPPVGPFRYIFTRKELAAADTDANGKFTSTYLTNNQDIDRPRNVALMNYLKTMTTRSLPGFGTTMQSHFDGADNRNAILAQIFDFIRCANTRDTTTAIAGGKVIKFAELGMIKPSQPDYLGGAKIPSGFGRFPTISEATLVFYYAGPKMATTDKVMVGPVGNPPAMKEVDNTGGWSKWDADTADVGPNKGKRKYVFIEPGQEASANKRPNRLMRAFLLFSTFTPTQGYAPYVERNLNSSTELAKFLKDPKLEIEVEDLDGLSISGQKSGGITFPSGPGGKLTNKITRAPGGYWGGRNYGGYEGFMHTLVGHGVAASPHKIKWTSGAALTASDVGTSNGLTGNPSSYTNDFLPVQNPAITAAGQAYYAFQSELPAAEFRWDKKTFDFSGGTIKVTLKYGGEEVQRMTMTFPPASGWPVPKGEPLSLKSSDVLTEPTTNVTTWLDTPTDKATTQNIGTESMRWYYWTGHGTFFPDAVRDVDRPIPFLYKTSLQASWSFATRLAWALQHSSNPETTGTARTKVNHYGDRWRCIVQPGDTVRSLIYWDGKDSGGATLSGSKPIKSGDLRLAALSKNISADQYMPHPDYGKAWSRACMLRAGDGNPYFPVGALGTLAGVPALSVTNFPNFEASFGNHVDVPGTFPQNRAFGNLPKGAGNNAAVPKVNGVLRNDGKPGDFDTGMGSSPDGPYVNKPDEGNVIVAHRDYINPNIWIYPIPYYGTWAYEEPGNTYTSPFRQMPSAVMMGSLLRRPADASPKAWETLSFSPRPAGEDHPGNQGLKDHMLLDLFHMPIVEPYPISEPFSTAGKVNLNYKIMPFDYITRSTALRATLHPVRVAGVTKNDFSVYKTGQPGDAPAGTYDNDVVSGYTFRKQAAPLTTNYRFLVDRDATLGWDPDARSAKLPYQGFEKVFDEGKADSSKGFFKSPSQICEMDLYPKGLNMALDTWWSLRTLGGDNVREKPYADLYPRITTKSNTYTVHMRVQTLRQLPRATGAGYLKWEEGKDAVLGEYRGATTIERYIDPADPRFTSNHPEYVNPDVDSIEKLYRFRSVVNKKFTPQ